MLWPARKTRSRCVCNYKLGAKDIGAGCEDIRRANEKLYIPTQESEFQSQGDYLKMYKAHQKKTIPTIEHHSSFKLTKE